ncbi:MAG TPA: TonB-dependent receptor [Chthoniobacterales bacterium]
MPSLAFAVVTLSAWAQAPDASPTATPAKVPTIVVTGQPLPNATVIVPTPELQLRGSDSASLLEQAPGAAVVRNGQLTGIVQLRGLSDDRVNVMVNGMEITPACPNHMDPPLLNIAPSSLQSLTVLAGISPVSIGGDNIGGIVLADRKPPVFSPSSQMLWSGDLGSFYRSSDDSTGVNGNLNVAGKDWSASYDGSWATADDVRIPDGTIRDSGFGSYQQHEGQVAGHLFGGVFEAFGGITRTRDAAAPAQPMDMIRDDSWFAGLRQTGDYSFGQLDSRIAFNSTYHLMDNFSLRPLTSMPDEMGFPFVAPSQSDDLSGSVRLAIPRESDTFRTGVDFHLNRFDASEKDISGGMSQEDINNATRSRVGVYFEWQRDWDEHWTTLAGVRNDNVWSDADPIERFYMDSEADALAFNSRSRDKTDINFDAMASVRFMPDSNQSYDLALARKTRSPSILERYLFTPFSFASGASDGRFYLGNLDLDPEVSYQIALTGDWHGDAWGIKVTPFYNFVHDYIQGTPTNEVFFDTIVLQYQNIDRADLYGVDGEAHYDINKALRLRGQLSYVRGIDRDNDDNLYRIAPLHGTVSLEQHWLGWRSAVELAWAAPQHEVATFNDELPSSGYAVLNLRAGYSFADHFDVDLVLDNLFDRRYAEHLSGINQVLDSDVPVGARIPEPGRFVAVSARYHF